jgi:tRNA modification GTPase
MHSDITDTIAAISTAPGEGGLSVVRVSGPESLNIADAVFRGPAPKPSERKGNTFVHGFAHFPESDARTVAKDADEVILLIYRAPASYTREEVVEFQGHGGHAAASRILRAVLEAGARPAEPGEFTRRAFLNGRIDLIQAEAVLDLIRARSDRAAAAAIEQMEGTLSNSFTNSYDDILKIWNIFV